MREVEEQKIWKAISTGSSPQSGVLVQHEGLELNLASPCLVIGGRNGAGKTRLLRSVADVIGGKAVELNLHVFAERVLRVLRSREDFEEMTEEYESVGPDADRLDDIQRIVGREYENVSWYALEIESTSVDDEALFRWRDDQSLVPYFKADYLGQSYSGSEMGLGELSVHLVFWLLDQFRDEEGVTVVLDEPDAYLPPVASEALFLRLARLCLDRGWQLIVSSHNTGLIEAASRQGVFHLLRRSPMGLELLSSSSERDISRDLLATVPPSTMLFVEDESAFYLLRALVQAHDRDFFDSCRFVWGNGSGYMVDVQKHFPKPPVSDISFGFIFDGDKRTEVKPSKSAARWTCHFLPTEGDPDDLFKSLRTEVDLLAAQLKVPPGELEAVFDSLEGRDAHDWVNRFAERYGRPRVLAVLAETWVELHPSEVSLFEKDLRIIRGV